MRLSGSLQPAMVCREPLSEHAARLALLQHWFGVLLAFENVTFLARVVEFMRHG